MNAVPEDVSRWVVTPVVRLGCAAPFAPVQVVQALGGAAAGVHWFREACSQMRDHSKDIRNCLPGRESSATFDRVFHNLMSTCQCLPCTFNNAAGRRVPTVGLVAGGELQDDVVHVCVKDDSALQRFPQPLHCSQKQRVGCVHHPVHTCQAPICVRRAVLGLVEHGAREGRTAYWRDVSHQELPCPGACVQSLCELETKNMDHSFN